jgi:hypothetical protein
MLSGIGDLEWKRVKFAGQRSQALFTGAENFCILACKLCKNGGEKDPTPFMKVVE